MRSMIGLLVAAGLLLTSFYTPSAHAQATRTWVSGVGDDANPCSRTAPCKTFAGAISKTAASGTISVLDPGGFGSVTITKAITLDGGGIEGSILGAGTNGVVINAGASDVVRLRNITIEGANSGVTGIKFNTGAALLLDRVRVQNFNTGYGLLFAPSGSSRLAISDSLFSDNRSGGILIQPLAAGFARVSVESSRITENLFGLRADDRSTVSIRNSFVSSNTANGLVAYSISDVVEMTVDNCQVTNNAPTLAAGAGIRAKGPLASVVLSDSVVTGNYTGLNAVSGADIASFGNNRITSNVVDGIPSGTLPMR